MKPLLRVIFLRVKDDISELILSELNLIVKLASEPACEDTPKLQVPLRPCQGSPIRASNGGSGGGLIVKIASPGKSQNCDQLGFALKSGNEATNASKAA